MAAKKLTTKAEFVQHFKDLGAEAFEIKLSKQAYAMLRTLGDELDMDDFSAFVKSNVAIGGGTVMEYMRSKGLTALLGD